MTKYTFIRIVNNKDPQDYYIDCTSLDKWRTRVSGLKTQMYRHIHTNVGKWRPVYDILDKNNYSFAKICKGDFDNLNHARKQIPLLRFIYDKRFETIYPEPEPEEVELKKRYQGIKGLDGEVP